MGIRPNRIFNDPGEFRTAAKKLDEKFAKLMKKKKFKSYRIKKTVNGREG